ncbi:hypothetical protein Tco_0088554 [Tanacetum coccineum]
MQHSHSSNDTCFRMDVVDEVMEEELDALLNDSEPFLSTSEKNNETSLDKEFEEFIAVDIDEILEQKEEIDHNFEASERHPMLEKGSYIQWASRFMRFLENKQEDEEQMRWSIEVGPYVRQLIPDPYKPDQPNAIIIKPVIKMSEINKKLYYAYIKVMNYLLQRIPNDICNSVNACKTAHQMWERIKRLTTLVNVMDRNQIHPQKITINTKFLNSLQPEWSKYVTMIHQNANIKTTDYYQGEIQGDAQEENLTNAMMLLARAITQHYSSPTNNRFRTSSNTRNKAVIHDGRIDIQSKNVGYAGNINRSAGNGMVQQMEANDQTIQ